MKKWRERGDRNLVKVFVFGQIDSSFSLEPNNSFKFKQIEFAKICAFWKFIYWIFENESTMILTHWCRRIHLDVNSYAGGMAVSRPYDFEIDFVRNPFFDQQHDFSLLSLNLFLHPFLK